MDPVAEFEARRTWLFGLAYRMLGSADEAEDVVQDAYLRWSGVEHAGIERPSAWLAKVVANLSLTRLTSARARRERYVGPWLPEPVLTEDGTLGPLETAEQRESVSLALLALLERLSPVERAVFVLPEAFEYSYREIAEVLELSEAYCRQLRKRAGDRLDDARPRFRADPGRQRLLVERFLRAAQEGDLRTLEGLLAADVTAWPDGGGKVSAARRPVVGAAKVARLYAGMFTRRGAVALLVAEVNGAPAIVAMDDAEVRGVLAVEAGEGRITALRAVANPDKLRCVARQASALSHLERLSSLYG